MSAAAHNTAGSTIRHPDGSYEFTCLDYVTAVGGKRVLAWTTWLVPANYGERRCIRIEVLP